MIAKALISVLLSATLIWLAPKTPPAPSQINKSESVVTAQPTESVKQPPSNSEQIIKPVEPEKQAVEPTKPIDTPKAEGTAEVQVLTDKESLMQAAGIPQSDWAATDYIVSHESSWNVAATNPESGAYGLCQALPKEKMASAGDDYNSNPVTQLKWCSQYAHSRYGGWWKSFAAWSAQKWW